MTLREVKYEKERLRNKLKESCEKYNDAVKNNLFNLEYLDNEREKYGIAYAKISKHLISFNEVKMHAKMWILRLLTWLFPLIAGVTIIFTVDTVGKIVASLFLFYNIGVVSICIFALIKCWFWKRDLEKLDVKTELECVLRR